MGWYINPTNDMTKEQFLLTYGTRVDFEYINKEEINYKEGPLPVCLVDNGPFTAAAIAFQEGEVEAFSLPDDYRPKIWFMVPKEHLLQFLPENLH